MHPSLNADIIRLFACELVESELKATAVSLACCCKRFEDLVLDVLWKEQDLLTPLLKCLPQETWVQHFRSFVSQPVVSSSFPPLNHLSRKRFQRIPTKAEWTRVKKYARRIRKLNVDDFFDSVDSETLLALQLRTTDEPFLPRLKCFECFIVKNGFIPFIPLFLSPQTTKISIQTEFNEGQGPSTMAVASITAMLPKLCPNLEHIAVSGVERNQLMTDAASEMLLACNREALRSFEVYASLTEEAREVLSRLPKLSKLWLVVEGHTLLSPVTLLNLTGIYVEYDDHLDWLEAFRGASLEKLESVSFHSKSAQIGDFLGAFESVALTASLQDTLLRFCSHTARSGNPNYRSLLSFKQLRELTVCFACDGDCSSVDDEVVTSLAQAMPKLEVLQLGGIPCETGSGVTVHGLITLASHCLHLSTLMIHFQADSFASAVTSAGARFPSINEPPVPREECALTVLEVGRIPFAVQDTATIAMLLLEIFPHILELKYTSQRKWQQVAENIRNFKRIGPFVRCASKARPVTTNNP